MTKAYEIIDHKYEVVVVGAGGAGLRATLGMAAAGLKTACITIPNSSGTSDGDIDAPTVHGKMNYYIISNGR